MLKFKMALFVFIIFLIIGSLNSQAGIFSTKEMASDKVSSDSSKIWIKPPVIYPIGDKIFLNWDDWPGGVYYPIIASSEPYGNYSIIDSVTVSEYLYTPEENETGKFFYIIAHLPDKK